MACLLTTGRKLNNKNRVGGLKAVYFADYGTLGAITEVAGEITVLAGTPDWFVYDLKGNSSVETTINSSRETGSTSYTQTLSLTLPVLDKATQEEIAPAQFVLPTVITTQASAVQIDPTAAC